MEITCPLFLLFSIRVKRNERYMNYRGKRIYFPILDYTLRSTYFHNPPERFIQPSPIRSENRKRKTRVEKNERGSVLKKEIGIKKGFVQQHSVVNGRGTIILTRFHKRPSPPSLLSTFHFSRRKGRREGVTLSTDGNCIG